MNDLNEQLESVSDQILAVCYAAEEAGRPLTNAELGQIQNLEKEQTKVRMQIKAQQAGIRGEKMIDERLEKLSGQPKQAAIPKSESTPRCFANKQDAFSFGQFVRASLLGNHGAMQYCKDKGLIKNAMGTGDNTKGGFLVPETLADTLVALREKFGVVRQNAQNLTMSDAVQLIPKMSTEVQAYFVGEGDPINSRNGIPTSDMGLTQIKLEAKKVATLTVLSNEIGEDSIVDIADMLGESIAYQFARLEDDCAFNGDGTSTYGAIVGIGNALAAGSKVTATSRTTFSALTMADFEACIGKAKLWNGTSPKWYISQQGWANSMQRLADAYSGNTLMNLADGMRKVFLGFEVVISQVLNSTLTTNTGNVACYFGDLSKSTILGTRRGLTLDTDKSIYYNYDALAVRATQRWDFFCHDRGDATNAGGIVAIIFG